MQYIYVTAALAAFVIFMLVVHSIFKMVIDKDDYVLALHEANIGLSDELELIKSELAISNGQLIDRKDRIDEMNKAIEEEYRVKPEIINEIIDIDFDSSERSYLRNAVAVFIGEEKNIEYIRYGMTLLDKMSKVFVKAAEVEHKNGSKNG